MQLKCRITFSFEDLDGTEVSSIESSPPDTSATFLIPKARKKITRHRETEMKITHRNLLGKGIYINNLILLLYDA